MLGMKTPSKPSLIEACGELGTSVTGMALVNEVNTKKLRYPALPKGASVIATTIRATKTATFLSL